MQIQESKPFYNFYFVKPTVVVRGVLWLVYSSIWTDYVQRDSAAMSKIVSKLCSKGQRK